MDISLAETMAKDEMEKFGLLEKGWTFVWTKSPSTFGMCREHLKVIELSKPLSFRNTYAEVRDTVLHEIAHALAGCQNGHNRIWKQWCLKVGAKPQRCYGSNVVKPKAKYRLCCGMCGEVIQETNKVIPKYKLTGKYHAACGPQSAGQLKLLQN